MANTSVPTIGRLAPSPTGAQHVGNARTYLIAWLAARSCGGRVVLRIEDIDSPRIKAGAAEQAVDDLRWLGLDWDGDPVVQTDRLSAYLAALNELQKLGLVYPCTCTRGDIEAAASAPPGPRRPACRAPAAPHCRERRGLGDRPFAWRLRQRFAEVSQMVSAARFPSISVRPAAISSSGNRRKLRVSTRCRRGDAAQSVTEVIRSDDLVPSTRARCCTMPSA